MNPLTETLIRAKELLEVPGAWVRGSVFNTDPGGEDLYTNAPEATSYCIYGAVWKAARERGLIQPGDEHHAIAFRRKHPLSNLLEDAKETMPEHQNYRNAADMNNQCGVKVAMQIVCKAIELSIADEPTNAQHQE